MCSFSLKLEECFSQCDGPVLFFGLQKARLVQKWSQLGDSRSVFFCLGMNVLFEFTFVIFFHCVCGLLTSKRVRILEHAQSPRVLGSG